MSNIVIWNIIIESTSQSFQKYLLLVLYVCMGKHHKYRRSYTAEARVVVPNTIYNNTHQWYCGVRVHPLVVGTCNVRCVCPHDGCVCVCLRASKRSRSTTHTDVTEFMTGHEILVAGHCRERKVDRGRVARRRTWERRGVVVVSSHLFLQRGAMNEWEFRMDTV